MEEKWVRWTPCQNLAAKYDIDRVCNDIKSLEILLTDYYNQQDKIIVAFKDSVYSFRSCDESLRVADFADLSSKYGNDFYGNWTFFKIENSSYAKWLSNQSYEFFKKENFIHFVFMGMNSVLDVVAAHEPLIKKI